MRTRRSVRKLRKVLLTLNLLLLFGCVAVIGLLIGGLVSVNRVLPDTTQLSAYRPKLNTVLYAKSSEGNPSPKWAEVATIYREQYRDPIALRDVPPQLYEATVAVEDRRFWRHQGVDPVGIARALYADVRHRAAAQGASTITQQLARSIWLTREKTVGRKVKEVLLALQMERKFSKDEILEMYLNEVYYGHGAYGIATAAALYYGKAPDQLEDLTLAQCALLAGLPQRPAAYSPFDHPQAAKRRRDAVLDAMVRSGYISRAEAGEAKREQIQRHLGVRKPRRIEGHEAPHFAAEVVKQLSDLWGEELVYSGGLRVYTTLDMRLQRAAKKALEDGVRSLNRRRVTQGALVCIEVETGRVLAMVGGAGPYEENQWNRATHTRPTGSAFKPYVYTTALMYGWGPNSTISGAKLTVPMADGRTHTFTNYGGGGGGTYTLRSALAHSVNCAAVRLLRDVGVDPTVRTASRMMGVPEGRFEEHRYLSLALGTAGLSPLEMSTGFSTIASGGMRPTPIFLDRVTDSRDEQLFVPGPEQVPIIHRDVAFTMRKMMEEVVVRGTAAGTARIMGVPCAGKTGTNEDWRDAWFVGFTPNLCTAVWVGRDDYGPTSGVAGSVGALPIWRNFMRTAVKLYKPPDEFPGGDSITGTKRGRAERERQPRSLLICVQTRMLANSYCPATEERSFGAGEAPTGRCTVHGSGSGAAPSVGGEPTVAPTPAPEPARVDVETVDICVDSGRLATRYCPQTRTAEFRVGTGPSGMCPIHRGVPTETSAPAGASRATGP